jgi:2-polyprenyl-3-methyl-5-hydroxy-6-metoxy-1,4-benzoquinol methylase
VTEEALGSDGPGLSQRPGIPAKPHQYYESDRAEFLDWVGGAHARVLDVGCGSGANADWYRAHGAVHVSGIEIDARSAAMAAGAFNRVFHGSVEAALDAGDLEGPFDLIVCADVLEHLVDPWTVLDRLRGLAHERTVLAVSVPNIRHVRALVRIAVGRGFAYEPSGIFDVTHLRFFTPRNAEDMVAGAGWRCDRFGAPTRGRLAPIRRVARRLTGGRSDHWLGFQTYVRAVPAPRGNVDLR